MAIISVKGCMCDRCGYVWGIRQRTTNLPRLCPKCKSAYWNTPRTNKTPAKNPQPKESDPTQEEIDAAGIGGAT